MGREPHLKPDLKVRPRRTPNTAIVPLTRGRYDGEQSIAMTTERITIDAAIMMGKTVIRGTRITVELILRKLAEGASERDLLEDYTHLTTEDIRAAVAMGRVKSGASSFALLIPVATR